MIHTLTGKREKLCQLVAAGATYTDAYLEAYQKPAGYDRKVAAEEGSGLMANTDIVLRVQELRRPVLRKFRRKLEYGLQKALEQCDVAWAGLCSGRCQDVIESGGDASEARQAPHRADRCQPSWVAGRYQHRGAAGDETRVRGSAREAKEI